MKFREFCLGELNQSPTVVFMSEVWTPLFSHYKNLTQTLIWGSYDVLPQCIEHWQLSVSSCSWVDLWKFWSCISNLIVLDILFWRTNFTSNTRWKSQTFHYDENLPGLANFRRIFKVIWIRGNYISRVF